MLQLDPKNLNAARVEMTIPVTRVTTASAGLTEHLLKPGANGAKPDFFGPSMAPARFVSTGVVARGQAARITGNLTLNGVTRPVVLDATFHGAGKAPAQMGGKENVGFHATTTIRRSDFGIGAYVPIVSDAVKLHSAAAFQISARLQAAASGPRGAAGRRVSQTSPVSTPHSTDDSQNRSVDASR